MREEGKTEEVDEEHEGRRENNDLELWLPLGERIVTCLERVSNRTGTSIGKRTINPIVLRGVHL